MSKNTVGKIFEELEAVTETAIQEVATCQANGNTHIQCGSASQLIIGVKSAIQSASAAMNKATGGLKSANTKLSNEVKELKETIKALEKTIKEREIRIAELEKE